MDIIPPMTPVTYNDYVIGHTVGDNYYDKPVIDVRLYPCQLTRKIVDQQIMSLEINIHEDKGDQYE